MREKWSAFLFCFVLAGGIAFSASKPAYAGEWVRRGDDWHYLNEDGDETIGWIFSGENWYYLDESGVMRTGWIHDGNDWYFMSEEGSMLSNTVTPDGYFVDESGKWLPSAFGNAIYAAGAPTKNHSVYNVDADYAIEADVNLNGSGGSVAKLVIFGNTAAMSFDIVTDSTPQGTYFYRENIHSNAPGGQEYSAINQYPKAEIGKTYHLMIAFRKDGRGTVYLDGELQDTFWNLEMSRFTHFDPAVEAGAMADGSSVQAIFSNIHIKKKDKISTTEWNTKNMDNNPGLYSDVSEFKSHGVIRIGGRLQLRKGENWDTAYDGTSGKIYFQ